MKSHYMIPIAGLLVGSACVAPDPNPAPIPGAIYLRVTQRVGCSLEARCVGAWPETTADGILAWLGPDTLVLYESRTFPQVAIPVARITKLEVCRGSPACARAAVNNAPGALLMAIAVGATVGGVTGGIDSAVFWAEAEVGEAAALGAASGAAVGAAGEGEALADELWEEVTLEQLRQQLASASPPPAGP